MTAVELHDAINLARLIGNADGINRVFRHCPEFFGLIRRLSVLGPMLVREGRIQTLVSFRPGMSSKEIRVSLLNRYLKTDALTQLPSSVICGLADAGGPQEHVNPFSAN